MINGKISRLNYLILSFLQQITIHYVLPGLSLRGGGRGFPPGYYEHGPWLLSSLLFAIQNYFSIHANSPGYVTNLPVSHMGHQISRIKLSYELFCVLILNLSHFLPKFEFSLILSSFSGAFLYIISDKDYHKSKLWWSVPHVRLHIRS